MSTIHRVTKLFVFTMVWLNRVRDNVFFFFLIEISYACAQKSTQEHTLIPSSLGAENNRLVQFKISWKAKQKLLFIQMWTIRWFEGLSTVVVW